MIERAYNPQEVLGPLMKRFGRVLETRREEGHHQMVRVIREELHVDAPHAERLLESLETSGLVEYEPIAGDEEAQPTRAPSNQPSREPTGPLPDVPRETGCWRIGPPRV